MWVIELKFSGDQSQRLAARPAHRARLAELHGQGVVVLAGPFADESGALVVLDVADRAAAERELAEDPYYRVPEVEVVSLREWLPLPL